MTPTRPLCLAWPCLLIASLAACSGTEPPSTGTGGSGQGATGGVAATGGGSGVGGAAAGTGGSGTGGSSGTSTTGGSAGTGTGGGGAVSGAAGAAAGTTATGGGAGTGQAGSGAGRGGRAAGGGAGTGSGGAAGSGAGTGGGSVGPSAGCGTPTTLTSERASIDVGGTMREYVLQLPDDYDPSKPYKLIFAWHWRGGVADDVVSGQIIGGPYYGLESRAQGSAIFVAPEGIDMGWANTGGRDINFLKAMLALFNENLCIDQGRIFSTGFSYGGMMSDAIGCQMADVFRAIAPNSGALYSGCTQSNDHPIAALVMHGDNDTVVPLADGQEARDVFLERNACGTATSPVDPSPCVSYSGCTEGYPVVYCEFSGGHMPWGPAPDTVWKFFNQF